MERYANEANRLYGVMEGRLAESEYLAGAYSIADIACWAWSTIAGLARRGYGRLPARSALVRRDRGAAGGAAGHQGPRVTLLDRAPVRRVCEALEAAGAEAEVVELAASARTAADAANSLGTALGAIVKSLVFTIDDKPAMALVAGDRQCDQRALPAAVGLSGGVRRADADLAREVTGFSIGGVAPVGLAQALPMAIDASLGRFETIYAAAGHPRCVFGSILAELARITGANVVDSITATPR